MGLDMYLRAEKYASSYRNPELRNKIIELVDASKIAEEDGGAMIGLTVGYWRKANAIHNWFVGSNEDDCRPIYIDREQLVELLAICSQVLAAKDEDLSSELLPSASGFFFGGTEYDDYYYDQVDYTIKLIEKLLDNTDDSWSFEYQASW